MPTIADQFADIGQLAGSHTTTERQVHHHDHQRVGSVTKAQQDGATPGWPGQRVIFQFARLQATQDTIAVLGETPEVAV